MSDVKTHVQISPQISWLHPKRNSSLFKLAWAAYIYIYLDLEKCKDV